MNKPTESEANEKQGRNATFWQTAGAVFWSFFGVRKSRDLERDVGELNPLHIVIAGVVAAAIFVIVLVTLVRWVIGSGIAA